MADDKYDFFDDDEDDAVVEPEKEDKPETPEDKEAKEIEGDTITRGHNRLRLAIYGTTTVLFIWFALWLWMRFFSPYTSEAVETGRIMEMKCQGWVFKTYEGKLLSEKFIDYPDRWIDYDFPFSVTNDSIAREVMRLTGSGRRVRLIYEEYHGTLPWRGASHRIITGVELDTLQVSPKE